MTTENPYAAPAAPVADPADPAMSVADETLKKIRYGWVAALFSAALTLLVTIIAMSGTDILGFSAWELLDVVWILGLAYGIYKKSRTCAVLMFVYFIASKILLLTQTGTASGVMGALLFGYFFWQGISGTFAYHKAMRQQLAPVVGND